MSTEAQPTAVELAQMYVDQGVCCSDPLCTDHECEIAKDAIKLAREVIRLDAERKQLREALLGVEWVYEEDTGQHWCYDCGNAETQGHEAECGIGRALSGTPEDATASRLVGRSLPEQAHCPHCDGTPETARGE